MDSEKIQNLEAIAGIASRIEEDLNQLKNWIKKQYFLESRSENVLRIDSIRTLPLNSVNYPIIPNSSLSRPIISTQQVVENNAASSEQDVQEDSLDFESLQALGGETTESNTMMEEHQEIKIVNEALTNETNESNASRDFYLGSEYSDEDVAPLPPPKKKKKKKITNKKTEAKKLEILKRIKQERIDQEERDNSQETAEPIPESSTSSQMINGEKPKFTCTICVDKSFSSSANLRRHEEIHSTNTFDCERCSKEFNTSQSLAKHISKIHKIKPRRVGLKPNTLRHPCNVEGCGRAFFTESALKNHHQEAHVGLKCNWCSKVCYKRAQLSGHIERVHLICAVQNCGRQFLGDDAMKAHKKKGHGKKLR